MPMSMFISRSERTRASGRPVLVGTRSPAWLRRGARAKAPRRRNPVSGRMSDTFIRKGEVEVGKTFVSGDEEAVLARQDRGDVKRWERHAHGQEATAIQAEPVEAPAVGAQVEPAACFHQAAGVDLKAFCLGEGVE